MDDENDATQAPGGQDNSMLPAIGGGGGADITGVNTSATNPGMQYTMTSFLKNPTNPVPDHQSVSGRSNRVNDDNLHV